MILHRSSGEVLLLLKSSDFVQHDLHRAFDNIEQRGSRESGEVGYVPTLALRKWSGLNPAMEFRCVVYDKAVVAICQRDTRSYYKFLTENSTQSKIESCILQDLFVSRGKPLLNLIRLFCCIVESWLICMHSSRVIPE